MTRRLSAALYSSSSMSLSCLIRSSSSSRAFFAASFAFRCPDIVFSHLDDISLLNVFTNFANRIVLGKKSIFTFSGKPLFWPERLPRAALLLAHGALYPIPA